MKFCNAHGIPHSRFLESWDEEDRGKAVAYEIHASEICGGCGTAMWEWDPNQGGSRFAYEPVEEICPGCHMKETLAKGESHPGKQIRLRPPTDG